LARKPDDEHIDRLDRSQVDAPQVAEVRCARHAGIEERPDVRIFAELEPFLDRPPQTRNLHRVGNVTGRPGGV
jgi:hypothetical protein